MNTINLTPTDEGYRQIAVRFLDSIKSHDETMLQYIVAEALNNYLLLRQDDINRLQESADQINKYLASKTTI